MCCTRLLRRGTKLHDHLGGCAYLCFPQPAEYLALTIQFVSVVVLFGRLLFYSGRIVRRHGNTAHLLAAATMSLRELFSVAELLGSYAGPYAARADTLFTNVCEANCVERTQSVPHTEAQRTEHPTALPTRRNRKFVCD